MDCTREVVDWLLQGDVSIVYQVKRDLLGAGKDELAALRSRIEREGWGKRLLEARRADGHWGNGFYSPKWTSTHYTLLDLKGLGLPKANRAGAEAVRMILEGCLYKDGGINYARTIKYSDVCLSGMVLGLACYFGIEGGLLAPIVDFLLRTQMRDGGWNCLLFKGAVHSSLHTTLSVLEGFAEYAAGDYTARADEIREAVRKGEEFILEHRLYKSSTTGAVIDPKMIMLSYPPRWRYDILRALEYFRFAGRPYDERMADAIDIVKKKQRKDGTWLVQMKHPGIVHFDMEKTGRPSRWNTLRALRVLNHFGVKPENTAG